MHNPFTRSAARTGWMSMFWTAIALPLVLTACDPGAEQACNADEDCRGAFMCVDNTCVEPTVTNVPFDASVDTRSAGDTIPGDAHTDTRSTDTRPVDTRVPPGSTYRFVRIDDLSADFETPDSGADIDAVLLEKTTGTVAFASTVTRFEHGSGNFPTVDPTQALGAPDAFFAYPDTSVCDVEGTHFVSLGGVGGLIVVEMALPVDRGDVLRVLEVGGCDFGGGVAIPEPVDVSVSTSTEIDANWIFLGSGRGPEISIEVPMLP